MSPDYDCQKLHDELIHLKMIKVNYDGAYEDGLIKKDFSECVRLYEQIKILLKSGEGEIGKMRFPDILRNLKLEEQYRSQLSVAWRTGLFGKEDDPEGLKTAKKGHKSRNNREGGLSDTRRLPVIERGAAKYPMPGWKEIVKIISRPENSKIIKEKSAQGFTKMLIVPFGCDLKTMADKFKEKLGELDQSSGIFSAGGEKIEFDSDSDYYPCEIISGWDDGGLTYYPTKFATANHGGLSKDEVIRINGAWQICFVEDMPVIPEDGKEIGGRRQIDRKGNCVSKKQQEYPFIHEFQAALVDKNKMVNPDRYGHENGQTPEQYIWMQLTSLLGKEQPVLMDYENNQHRGTYLTGSFNYTENKIPFAVWNKKSRAVIMDHSTQHRRNFEYGVRSAVNIKK